MGAHKFAPKSIIITGASSGIGQALAEYYAASGVTLGLIGRDKGRLQNVVQTCLDKGAQVSSASIDVTDREAMSDWILAFDAQNAVDMVVANAGISAGTEGVLEGEPPEQVRRVFDVNLNGVLNTFEPVQAKMIKRKSGRLVIMSSLAGYRGWPGAPAYCGSKAAVKVYGESLRGALKKTGVHVHVVCPGFVKSRMTDVNKFPMPFMVEAEQAAKIIARNVQKNKGRIAFPFLPALVSWFVMILPDCLGQAFLAKTPSKSSTQH